METKFTPAPWSFIDGSDYVLTEAGRMICDMSYSEPQEHSDYNANLIKTSPKLYNMLREIEQLMGWGYSNSELVDELQGCRAEIAEVLAEARGETNE